MDDKTNAGGRAARSRARGPVAVDDVVDLKAELRTEAAKSAPARSLSGTEVQTMASDTGPRSLVTDLASRSPSKETGSGPDSEILVGPGGQSSSAEAATREDAMSGIQAALDAVDLERISGQAMDVAAQVTISISTSSMTKVYIPPYVHSLAVRFLMKFLGSFGVVKPTSGRA